jgi:hypothetical protein
VKEYTTQKLVGFAKHGRFINVLLKEDCKLKAERQKCWEDVAEGLKARNKHAQW